MKVLHLTTILLPFTETFVLDQLTTQGVEHVIVGVKEVEGFGLDNVVKYCLYTNTGIKRLPKGWPFLVKNEVYSFVDRIIKEEKPDAILIHFGTSAHFFAKVAVDNKIPFFIFIYGEDVMNQSVRRLFNLYWLAAKLGFSYANQHSTGLFTSSNYLADQAIKLGFSKEKIDVHYLGVHVSNGVIPESKDRERRILFVGRLIHKKGPDNLIRAFNKLCASGTDLTLDIVGDGEMRSELMKLAAGNPKIVFHGRLSRDEVIDRMSKSLFFCMPSRKEGLGMVYLEAQSVGTPVIALSSTGSAETMINNETGLYFDDPEGGDLLQVLRQVDEMKPESWQDMSDRARERIKRDFEVTSRNKELFRKISLKIGKPMSGTIN